MPLAAAVEAAARRSIPDIKLPLLDCNTLIDSFGFGCCFKTTLFAFVMKMEACGSFTEACFCNGSCWTLIDAFRLAGPASPNCAQPTCQACWGVSLRTLAYWVQRVRGGERHLHSTLTFRRGFQLAQVRQHCLREAGGTPLWSFAV